MADAVPRPERLTPDLALWLVGRAPATPEETARLLAGLGPAAPSREVAQALVGHLEAAELLGSPAFKAALEPLRPAMAETPLGALVLAYLQEAWGDLPGASRLFRGVASEASVLVDLVRVLTRMGEAEEACAVLRRAAGSTRDFTPLTKAARQLERLRETARATCPRTLRLALLYPHTTDLWVPLLRLALFREGIWAEVWTAPYGACAQAVLDPGSALYAFDPELVILASTWMDLNLEAFHPDPAAAAQTRVAEVVERWDLLRARTTARLIQHDFALPAADSGGHAGRTLPGGRGSILRRINEELLAAARDRGVTVLGLDHLAACHGKRAWEDPGGWFGARQYPAARALPDLVEGQVARIRACLGLTRKVLVLDLDNTLWGGVVSEDGPGGLQVGPGSPQGEAFLALQRYVAELRARGILLAVCSKNDPEDAREPFLSHEGMHLRLEDFAAFTANWKDKPGNLRDLAGALNLGLDSFVFLDDNPAERALMRRELPDVAVPELGPDPARYVEILDASGLFDVNGVLPEDLDRNRNYQANLQRETRKAAASSLEDYLQELRMVCAHGPVADPVLARVVQLLGKTNQFNLTNRRHGEARVRQLMAEPSGWTQYFRLKDACSDNGIVGVLIAQVLPGEPLAWEVDTWLMSCRVLGRQLEPFMFHTLVQAARSRGIERLQGTYVPSPKNGAVSGLYPSLGFTGAGAGPDGQCFSLALRDYALPPPRFIQDLSPDAVP